MQLQEGELRGVIAEDPVSKRVLSLAESVARTPSTVLLTGESGAGKEVIARFIHTRSDRAGQPFVAINCAALPPNLLESELFGHEKGAFSGAVQQHHGMFERARGGTILLDEISEMSVELQAKLLRVLQERVMYRVGGSKEITLDVRIIATSNRDLQACVEEGSFRRDLYYRLNVFPLHIPSLRERPKDIEALIRHYLPKFAESLNRPVEGMSARALKKLQDYSFPGNVRELVNVIERAVILALNSEYIDVEHIVLDTSVDPSQFIHTRNREGASTGQRSSIRFVPGAEPLTEVRMRVILSTLEKFEGNRTHTAEALGVSLRTIRNKIRKYRDLGMDVPESGH